MTEQEQAPKKRGAIVGFLALLALILFKGKGLVVLLLTKLKLLLGLFKLKSMLVLLKSGGSMLLMIWVYALAWPVSFAIGFAVLLMIHELGHAFALRALGIRFSAPLFIPFVGALIGLKEMPADVGKEALVAFAGPFAGTIGAQVCLVLYNQLDMPVMLGLAQVGYMLNLINLAPYSPLDGGRIVGAISPKIWIAALPLMLIIGLYYHSIILLLVTALGIPRAISAWRRPGGRAPQVGHDGGTASGPPAERRKVIAWRKRNDPEHQAYFQVPMKVRVAAGAGYLGLAGFLALMMSHVASLRA